MFKHNLDSVMEMYNSLMGALVEVSPKFKKLDHLLGGHYTEGLKKNDEILDYLRKVSLLGNKMASPKIFFRK
jgi:hypothetical protein